MVRTPNIDLPYLISSSDTRDVINETSKFLDAFLGGVEDRDLTSPPGSPTHGQVYIVGASASGAWSGQDNALAYYHYGDWLFYTPTEGWCVWAKDENVALVFDGSAWIAANKLLVKTVATLPTGSAGDIAYASDGRKAGEGAGLGTGVLVFKDGSNWIACDTGATVAA